MPIKFATAFTPRYDADFVLEAVPAMSPEENRYLLEYGKFSTLLAADQKAERARNPTAPDARSKARQEVRSATGKELKRDAEKVIADPTQANEAADSVLILRGRYELECQRLDDSLFVVGVNTGRDDNGHKDGLATELQFVLSPSAPGPRPSPEQQALFQALNSAETVIKTVYGRQLDETSKPRTKKRIRALLDEYIRKLYGIARVGLEGPDVQLASLALEGVKTEFVAQEAGRIKNTYLIRLGLIAALATLVFLALYVAVEYDYLLSGFWTRHKPFLLAGAGAAVGSWLSFSIRRVSLSFNDLAILEEDLLDPSLRILFVVGLTFVACLLLWNRAVSIEIGSLKTVGLAGSQALLIGVFCGLAERALATALSGRAAAFIKTVGGS